MPCPAHRGRADVKLRPIAIASARFRTLWLLVAAAAWTAAGAAAAEPQPSGWRWQPAVEWSSGDHAVDLGVQTRYRWEHWQSQTEHSSNFNAFRVRLRSEEHTSELQSR